MHQLQQSLQLNQPPENYDLFSALEYKDDNSIDWDSLPIFDEYPEYGLLVVAKGESSLIPFKEVKEAQY